MLRLGKLGQGSEANAHRPRPIRPDLSRRARRSTSIGLHVVEATTRTTQGRPISRAVYLLTITALAFIFTVSMSIPAVTVVIGAVLLRPDRWKQPVLCSSLGSAIGGVALYLLFHHLGWNEIAAAYPDLVQSKAWTDATKWIEAYGVWALFAIAASPLPQTPALIFTAVSPLLAEDVFFALFLAKLVKYGIYGWLAAKCPVRFGYVAGRRKPVP
jgi:membrane protein YqaA with SNARE-associated domain